MADFNFSFKFSLTRELQPFSRRISIYPGKSSARTISAAFLSSWFHMLIDICIKKIGDLWYSPCHLILAMKTRKFVEEVHLNIVVHTHLCVYTYTHMYAKYCLVQFF